MKDLDKKLLAKIARFMRKILEFETLFEDFRVFLLKNYISLQGLWQTLTKYREDELSLFDFRHFFVRKAFVIDYDELKLLFDRMDTSQKELINKE